jgi:hypothetical protein
MGTIYLKADLSAITAENIHQFNIYSLERSEVYDLIDAGHRELLLKNKICDEVQFYIHDKSPLTLEECKTIIEHNTELWNDIGRLHEYSSEFLMEHGEKLSKISIENQLNITPAFVTAFRDNLRLHTIYSKREAVGDICDFLVTPELCGQYLSNNLSHNTTKATIVELVERCTIEPELHAKIMKLINDWYDIPIDINKLINDYKNRERAHYSIQTVSDYWNSNSRKAKYDNWEDYIACCKETHADGLASTWYQSYFRGPFLDLMGYDN